MEFLVEMQIDLPPDIAPERAADLRAKEGARSLELYEAGAIVRIWRLPGRSANVGVWEAPDATELHALIASLPLFPWLDVTVSALARHPTEDAAGRGAGDA